MASNSTISEVPLTAQGQADLAWLEQKLGDRCRGPVLREDGDYEVEMVRLDGRRSWAFGRTPEAALARARKTVEGAAVNRRIS